MDQIVDWSVNVIKKTPLHVIKETAPVAVEKGGRGLIVQWMYRNVLLLLLFVV
jgi:hypothetical protein